MNIEQVLPLLRAGKKVGHEQWDTKAYWVLRNGKILTERGGEANLDEWLLKDGFVEFQEPLTDDDVLTEVAAKRDELVAELGEKLPRKVLKALEDVERLIRERKR